MSFGIEFEKQAEDEFYSWDLPLEVIEEIERRREVELSEHPTRYPRNLRSHLQYVVRLSNPSALTGDHLFGFRVRFSRDEQTLIIWDCFRVTLRS